MALQLVSEEIRAKYLTWQSARERWLQRARECREYYKNDVDGTFTNFTQEQLELIKQDLSNLPISYNLLHSTVQQRTALLLTNKYSSKLVSYDARTIQHAEVLDKAKQGILYQSKFNAQMKQVIKDFHISGHGYLYIDIADKYYPGQFNVSVRHLPYGQVILDNNSQDPLYGDAEGFFIEKEITESELLARFNYILQKHGVDDIRSLGTTTWTSMDQSAQAIDNLNRKYELRYYYDKVYTNMYIVNLNNEAEMVFEENETEDAQLLIQQAKDEGNFVPDLYVRKRIIIGNYIVWEEILPITHLPIVVFYYDFDERPYNSYGLVHFIIGIQEANDKTLQLMLTNGMLTNNAGYIIPKGSIDPNDRVKWANQKPGTIKEYIPKVIEGVPLKPEREVIQGLSNFYPTVHQISLEALREVSGITPILSGNTQDKIEVFSTLQAYQNAALQRVLMSSLDINTCMEVLGNIIVEFLLWTIRKGTYIYFDPNNKQYNELAIADDINNFKLNKFSVVAIPSEMVATQRLAHAESLYKIAQSSPDLAQRNILTKKAMELADIPDAAEIIQQIDYTKNLEAQIQQLEESIKRERELTKQMENKLINTEIENRILKQSQNKLIKLAEQYGQAELSLSDKIKEGEIYG